VVVRGVLDPPVRLSRGQEKSFIVDFVHPRLAEVGELSFCLDIFPFGSKPVLLKL